MRTGVVSVVLFWFFLLLTVGPSTAAPVSASVPLDSWIYPALDKLAGLGLIDSALQGSRPYSRHEAARLTRKARDNAGQAHPPPVALEILGRLERELKAPLAELEGASAKSYILPLREFRLDYLYQDGPLSTPSPATGTNALQHALNTNNFGIRYQEGSNGQALLETEARLGRSFLVNWRPMLNIDEDFDPTLRTLHGTATLGLGPIQISAGRESLWWGQGRHGSLILTNNARPLDMLRITNPEPAVLPWIFSYLGPFRFDVFLSELESDRHVSEPYLFGLRVNFKPASWVELGASRVMMYGGEGRPGVGFTRFLKLFAGRGTNVTGAEENLTNQIAALDARIKLPVLKGVELYGELGGEDEAGTLIKAIPFPAKKALLTGLYFPKIGTTGRLALRLEYADLNFQGNGPVWYGHGTYRSGYTYRGHIIGHHVGGDARDYYAALEWFLPHDALLTMGVDIERRGLSTPTTETHFQTFASLKREFAPGWDWSVQIARDEVENAGFISGVNRQDFFAAVGLRGWW